MPGPLKEGKFSNSSQFQDKQKATGYQSPMACENETHFLIHTMLVRMCVHMYVIVSAYECVCDSGSGCECAFLVCDGVCM